MVNRGVGYVSAPSISFIGGGIDAAAVAQINDAGEVISITITNEGSGYNTAPEVEVA